MSYTLDGYLVARRTHFPSSPRKDAGLGPVRPKRRQVKNACTRCQKACKKCDDARPCLRCIKYGCSDGCISSVRKERKKGFKRGPYKKRDAEAQSILGRLSSYQAAKKKKGAPTQHPTMTGVSAFTSSPLIDAPPPTWDTDSYSTTNLYPAYQVPAITEVQDPVHSSCHYLNGGPALRQTHPVEHHPQHFYVQVQPQAPPTQHQVQYFIPPELSQSSQHYTGTMGHMHGVPDVLSYHAHHHYHT